MWVDKWVGPAWLRSTVGTPKLLPRPTVQVPDGEVHHERRLHHLLLQVQGPQTGNSVPLDLGRVCTGRRNVNKLRKALEPACIRGAAHPPPAPGPCTKRRKER